MAHVRAKSFYLHPCRAIALKESFVAEECIAVFWSYTLKSSMDPDVCRPSANQHRGDEAGADL
jgi:hypothetical protein